MNQITVCTERKVKKLLTKITLCSSAIYRVRPSIRLLDPPPYYQFCTFCKFFSKLVYIFRVMLGPLAFLGRALRLGQARGPSAAARRGQGAGRCDPITHFINVLNMSMYKIDRRGRGGGEGVQKSYTRKLYPKLTLSVSFCIQVTS